MTNPIKIVGNKSVAKWLDKILARKKKDKEKSMRKFKNGEIKINE